MPMAVPHTHPTQPRAPKKHRPFLCQSAKRQVRGVKESPENNICCLSNRLNMFDSAIESLTRVDSNALFRF